MQMQALKHQLLLIRVKSKIRQSWALMQKHGEYVDMIAEGIIDPAKVTRSAIQNAASIAGLLLTTEATICDIPEEKKETAAGAPGMGGMGGMPGMY